MKAKIIDGKTYRCRRGVWVEIPDEWIGKFPTRQTKRHRHCVSRRTRKLKNRST